MKEVIVLRPRVTPSPTAREALEAKIAAVVPPPNAVMLRDQWQKRPEQLRKQSS